MVKTLFSTKNDMNYTRREEAMSFLKINYAHREDTMLIFEKLTMHVERKSCSFFHKK